MSGECRNNRPFIELNEGLHMDTDREVFILIRTFHSSFHYLTITVPSFSLTTYTRSLVHLGIRKRVR